MAQVGCAGILVADTFCGPMEELPREGQLLLIDAIPIKAGGCAANVAIDLAKQGISADVVGCVGNDPSARVLLASLEEFKVGTGRIVYSQDQPTSQTVVLLVAGQDRRFIHSFGANAAFTASHIDRDWVQGLKIFYLGGLFLMPAFRPDELLDLLRFCRSRGVSTVVDVVIPQNVNIPRDLGSLLSAIDYFLPNEDEAQTMTGLTDPFEQLRAFHRWGANTVVITRGRKGVMAGKGQEFWQAGIYEIPNAVDPTGCGDAFAAGLVTGILNSWDMPATIRYASALGASAIRALGTTGGVFTASQAEEFIENNHLKIRSGKL